MRKPLALARIEVELSPPSAWGDAEADAALEALDDFDLPGRLRDAAQRWVESLPGLEGVRVRLVNQP
jgi:hypothetical protein